MGLYDNIVLHENNIGSINQYNTIFFDNINHYNIIDIESDDDDIMNYGLDCRINQSIDIAATVLPEEYRPADLRNNVVQINGQNLDLYDYLIVENNLNPGEFALVALSSNKDMWYARKTRDNLVQYYHFTSEDSFSYNDYFSLFIQNYKQREHL